MSEETPPASVVVEKVVGNAVDLAKRQQDAKRRLWAAGELSWKFKGRPWQRAMYDFVRTNWGASPYLFILGHRRSGKSTTGEVIAIEECLREPNTRCAVICKTKDQAQEICDVTMVELLSDCPEKLKPRKIKNDFAYSFDHNGSFLKILSLDGKQGLKARGRKFRFILITEACFIENLDRIVRRVLAPTLRDVTGSTTGTILLESTPPDEDVEPQHAQAAQALWDEAELDGRGFFLPLSQNKWASPDFVAEVVKDCGGVETVDYQREYELKFIVEKNATAVPEFTLERAFKGDSVKGLPPIVREVARPGGADRYESLDPGGTHLSAELWGFYDFEQDMVVIEDEATFENVTSDVISTTTKERELKLWGERPDGRLVRVADNNNVILLNDLHREHKLLFHATRKDSKDAQINKVRLMVRDGRLAIHPRCVLLIKTLRLAKRARQANKGFVEMAEIGHADLLDALIYLVRNVRKHLLPEQEATNQLAAQQNRVEQVQVQQSSSQRAFRRALFGPSGPAGRWGFRR